MPSTCFKTNASRFSAGSAANARSTNATCSPRSRTAQVSAPSASAGAGTSLSEISFVCRRARWLRQRLPVIRYNQLRSRTGSRHCAKCRYARTRLSATASAAASGFPSIRVAKRSKPGSYRRMRIPNASPSPPRTRATTSTSLGALSVTMRVTHEGGGWSRYSQCFPGRRQERGRAQARATHGAGECLQRRLRPAPVRGIARHLRQPREQARSLGIGTGQHVVEDVLRPVAKAGRRLRAVEVAADGVGVAAFDDGGEVDRDREVARLVADLVRRETGRRDLYLILQQPRSEEHTSELQSPCNLV